jgi:hypothetical protein
MKSQLIIPRFSDPELNQLAEALRRFEFLLPTFNAGVSLEVSVTPSGVTVRHGLGKKPEGFLVTLKRQAVDVWVNNEDEQTVRVFGTANALVRLWVF